MDDLVSRQAVIDTEGLEEEIRCEMCKNPMHTDKGCDGNCKYDEKLYEKIIQILDERIKPLPSVQPEVAKDINVPSNDTISRQAAIDALGEEPGVLPGNNEYEHGLNNQWHYDVNALKALPSAQLEPHYDEWCTDCKEYDQERHCCPRWNRVIRETLKDAQPEIIYCKDCRKHNVNAGYKEDCCPLYEWRGMSYGHEHDYQFCCYAERRVE